MIAPNQLFDDFQKNMSELLAKTPAADIERNVLGARIEQPAHQPPPGRHDHGPVPGAHQRVGDFEGGPFDAAGLQRRQQLHDGQRAGYAPAGRRGRLSRPG